MIVQRNMWPILRIQVIAMISILLSPPVVSYLKGSHFGLVFVIVHGSLCVVSVLSDLDCLGHNLKWVNRFLNYLTQMLILIGGVFP